MAFFLAPPPGAEGSDKEQLVRIRSWLYQMSDNLNSALNHLTADNLAAEEAQAITNVIQGVASKGASDQANGLKTLIMKTADSIRASVDQINATLASDYVAQSEFGTYKAQARNDITASANGVLQQFESSETVQSLQEGQTSFSTYVTSTSQYIMTGYLFNETIDGVSVPRYGVAVGDKITSVSENGDTVLERTGDMATFVSDELAFWHDGTKVAYMRQNHMYIENAVIKSRLSVGNYSFVRLADGSMGIVFEG